MKTTFLTIILSWPLLADALATRGSQTARLIVFGDSFSDNGNGSWVVSKAKFPIDPAYYKHSWTNGPVWTDVAAHQLGLGLVNYAIGGATTDNDIVQGFTGADSNIPVPSVSDQISSFLSRGQPKGSEIFAHWTGANDILFDTNMTGVEVVGMIEKNVIKLLQHGAKKVLLANYNDVSAFPVVRHMPEYSIPNVQAYMQDLTTGLKNISRAYAGKVAFVDVGKLMGDMLQRPTAYGCAQKYTSPPTACLTGIYADKEPVTRSLCRDPDRHVFFDEYHPVAGVHVKMADLFVEAISRLGRP